MGLVLSENVFLFLNCVSSAEASVGLRWFHGLGWMPYGLRMGGEDFELMDIMEPFCKFTH